MTIEKVNFQNSNGKRLSAKLELPIDRRPLNFAVFAHCFTCNKNFNAVRYISSALAAEGFGVLSFDFTGLGESEGEFADTNFSSSVDDLVCAAEFLRTNYESPGLIVGHSLGGAAAILAASRLEEVKAVVTIGAPSAPAHVRNLLENEMPEIVANDEALVSIGGRPFTIKRQFIEDLEKHELRDVVRQMRKAFLFMHSPQDRIVAIDNAALLYEAARHPKSFISLDGAITCSRKRKMRNTRATPSPHGRRVIWINRKKRKLRLQNKSPLIWEMRINLRRASKPDGII